jgi:hypothetical protein
VLKPEAIHSRPKPTHICQKTEKTKISLVPLIYLKESSVLSDVGSVQYQNRRKFLHCVLSEIRIKNSSLNKISPTPDFRAECGVAPT